ncbi:hypothetical protein [Streptomyces niveus]|uniref:hypothetical protein n=1 Tax=Streptomyces niveus TaxID=193462 RepID=UPI00365DC9CC
MPFLSGSGVSDDHIELAQQLLTGLDLRVTSLTTQIAALVHDAGTTGNLSGRLGVLRTETGVAGLASMKATLELAGCFHHAVLGPVWS